MLLLTVHGSRWASVPNLVYNRLPNALTITEGGRLAVRTRYELTALCPVPTYRYTEWRLVGP
ncbi:hypothetical protein GCM10009820_17810 [Leifsonia soli]